MRTCKEHDCESLHIANMSHFRQVEWDKFISSRPYRSGGDERLVLVLERQVFNCQGIKRHFSIPILLR